MLPTLLYNIFFAAVLLVTIQQFREDADVLADHIRLQEQPSMVGPERALECVRLAVWRIPFADDACIVS